MLALALLLCVASLASSADMLRWSREGVGEEESGGGGGQRMELIMFDDEAKEPTAVCNDGTRGGYYFSPASHASQADVFVLYLPGGGQCWDEDSCASRDGTYISSKSFPPTRSVHGILDSDPAHTPLWGANKAYLGYCSSDGYMGDVGASEDTWGWAFRGASLVRAMVRALEEYGLQSARQIYVVGTSAGGRGVMVHLDALVRDFLPQTAEVIGFLDSPYYLDIDPYSEDFPGFAYEEQQKFLLFNTTSIIDADCAAAYPTEQWKCQFGQYRMPFVDTSFFLIASQYDSYQLSNNIRADPPQYTEDMRTYATNFGALDREDLFALTSDLEARPVGAEGAKGYGIYAWACYNHAMAISPLFYKASTDDGVSQKDAFEYFISTNPSTGMIASSGTGGDSGSAVRLNESMAAARSPHAADPEGGRRGDGSPFVLTWIDSCEEFACGQNCHV